MLRSWVSFAAPVDENLVPLQPHHQKTTSMILDSESSAGSETKRPVELRRGRIWWVCCSWLWGKTEKFETQKGVELIT